MKIGKIKILDRWWNDDYKFDRFASSFVAKIIRLVMATDISIYISNGGELCEIEVKYTRKGRQREQSVSKLLDRRQIS